MYITDTQNLSATTHNPVPGATIVSYPADFHDSADDHKLDGFGFIANDLGVDGNLSNGFGNFASLEIFSKRVNAFDSDVSRFLAFNGMNPDFTYDVSSIEEIRHDIKHVSPYDPHVEMRAHVTAIEEYDETVAAAARGYISSYCEQLLGPVRTTTS